MTRLLRISFRQNRGSFAAGAAGVAVGAFIVVFFLGLVAGVRSTVETKIFPEESIEVTGSGSNVLDTVSLLTGRKDTGTVISAGRIERIARIHGVVSVHPRLRLMFPAKAYGGREIFGVESGTDIVGDGVSAALLAGERFKAKFMDYYPLDSAAACRKDRECGPQECCFIEEVKGNGACRHPVPFAVSNRLLEIYNTLIAPSHNLVRLPEWTMRKFMGFRIKMVVGRSYQGRAVKGIPETVCAVFAGVSRQAADIGVTVPIEYAERWNERYSESFRKGSYSSAVLTVARKRDLGRVIQDLKRIGLEVVSRGQEEIGFFVGILNGIFIFISVLMVMVSSIGIYHVFYNVVFERKMEIGIMRALGASKRLIMNLYLVQGLLVGLAGGAAGIAAALAASLAADQVAGRYFPDFPFRPDTFFRFDLWIIALAMGLSLISCLAGAYMPARKAARQSPMEVLG